MHGHTIRPALPCAFAQAMLVAWTHPGFSSHIAEAIRFENKKAIEGLACYLVHAPLSPQNVASLPPMRPRSFYGTSTCTEFEAVRPSMRRAWKTCSPAASFQRTV